jgi:hypothetical protein
MKKTKRHNINRRENQNFQNMSWQFFRPSSCLHASMNFFTYWTWQQLWPQARPGVVAGWGAFDFYAMETFAQKQLHADHLEAQVVSCLPSRVAVTTVLSLWKSLQISIASLDVLPPNLQISKSPACGSCLCFTRTVIMYQEESRKQSTEGLGFRV